MTGGIFFLLTSSFKAMNQKPLLLTVAVLALLVMSSALWLMQKRQVVTSQPVATELVDENSIRSEMLSTKEEAEEYARNWGGDTSDWKVYMNDEFGFVMRYPEEVFDLRILPVSEGVGVYLKPLPPKEFGLSLTQKGYSQDDYKHQVWMRLNGLKSEKEYYAEVDKNFIATQVVFTNKKGKIFGTKSTIVQMKNEYDNFLSEGVCNQDTFTINFDDIKNPNGDVRSYIHIGCESGDGNDMGRIYRAIYQSMRFF